MGITKISNDLIDLNQSGDFSGLRIPEGTTADRSDTFTTDYLVVGGGGAGGGMYRGGGGGAGGLRTSYNNSTTTTNSLSFPAGKTAIATYMLDNDATDISGNYNGTESYITYNTGKYGGGAVFNGSNSSISITDAGIGNNATARVTYSISIWVKTISTSAAAIIGDYDGTDYSLFLQMESTGKLQMGNYMDGVGSYTTGNTVINNGSWHNLVIINNTSDNTQKLFINGNNTPDINHTLTSGTKNAQPIQIGYYATTGGYVWNGSIDQVRFYNIALGSSDISNIYSNEVQAPSGGGTPAESSVTLLAGTSYNITVGDGGIGVLNNAGGDGGNSVFNTITSDGGGGGSEYSANSGRNGGSGGGSAGYASTTGSGGNGTLSQGYAGGQGNGGGPQCGGGGGGASTIGKSGGSGATDGDGGDGINISILNSTNATAAGIGEVIGTDVWYSGGAGGGNYGTGNITIAGKGGGAAGASGSSPYTSGPAGTSNTGGAGGGGNGETAPAGYGGNGGSGIVILRYPTASVTGFTVTGTLNTPSTTDTIADNNYPTTNLAYYKLDGNATDSSGNGYNGTATNITYGAGKFSEAAIFNGSSSYITLSTVPFPVNNFTVSAWMNVDAVASAGNYNMILATANSNSWFYFGYEANYLIYYNNANGSITGGTSVARVWQHCVLTQSSTTGAILYLDGVAVGSNAAFTGDNTGYTAGQNLLGNYNTGSGAVLPYSGKMDQVRILSTALSATQVTELYNESYQTKFTEGSDTILAFNKGTGTVTFSGTSPAPPAGSIRYNTTTKTVEFYNGAWVEIASTNYCTTNTLNFPAGAGCIASYNFNNNVNDIGNTYNGTNSNVTFNASGKFGADGAFNGSNSQVTVTSFSSLTLTQVGISMWVNMPDISQQAGLIARYGSTYREFAIYMYGGDLIASIYYNGNNGNATQITASTYMSNDTWHHIAYTADGVNQPRLYIDGTEVGSAASNNNTYYSSSEDLNIGHFAGISAYNYEGKIDQVRIFNSAISSAQVGELYTNEIACS